MGQEANLSAKALIERLRGAVTASGGVDMIGPDLLIEAAATLERVERERGEWKKLADRLDVYVERAEAAEGERDQHAEDLLRVCTELGRARKALEAADEALAQVTAFEADAREIMGNTNFAIVQQRREQVRAALSVPAEERKNSGVLGIGSRAIQSSPPESAVYPWRDISSAPRDGTVFIGCNLDHPSFGSWAMHRRVRHTFDDSGEAVVTDLGGWAIIHDLEPDYGDGAEVGPDPDFAIAQDELNRSVRYGWMPMPTPAEARSEQVDWRPIETAPKDGTHVVVHAPKTPGKKARTSRRGCVASIAHYESGWGWLTTPGDYQVAPTHWQPLPTPPKAEADHG
jgi:hypothetical protein